MKNAIAIASVLLILPFAACDSGAADSTEEGSGEATETVAASSHEAAAQAVAAGFTVQTVNGNRAGGNRNASDLNGDCYGFIPTTPHATVTVTGDVAIQWLAVSPTAGADLTLTIEGPNGTFFCDDDGADIPLMPTVTGTFPAGVYNVYVGTYSEDATEAFVLTTMPWVDLDAAALVPPTLPPGLLGGSLPPVVADGPAPTPTANGLQIAAGTGPGTLTGAAGGTTDATTLGAGCWGNIPAAPQHTIEVQADQALTFRAVSETDTTIAIRSADGTTICNDDADGLNPGIHQPFVAGTYEVFVGTFMADNTPPYTLTVSR